MQVKVHPEALSQALLEIEGGLSALPEDRRLKALLICEEIVTNQLRHADFEGRIPEISVQISMEKNEKIRLLFQDNGALFNPLQASDPDLSTELQDCTPGGLGIYLVKQSAETIRYSYEDEHSILEVTL
ncbi:ATP-binding protein [Desulfogranum mediterraneum]|uniref:ATP-binding protein n=1 Tax=Desulfogranum mediterraneum TaxID=160661 RepID=UPI00054CE1B6|nr:ATP-binding protein [Desulfogranum mediterraneum]